MVIHDIFPGLRLPGGDTDVRRIAAVRRVYPRIYAHILLACTNKQLTLLRHLWQDRFPCIEMLDKALTKLIDSGFVPELLDPNSKHAELLLENEYRPH